jgi:hypothetical protein
MDRIEDIIRKYERLSRKNRKTFLAYLEKLSATP